MKSKNLLSFLFALCLLAAMALPVHAESCAQLACTYQAQCAASCNAAKREAAYANAVKAYQAQCAAKAEAEAKAILAAGRAAHQAQLRKNAAIEAEAKHVRAAAVKREADYAAAVKAYQCKIIAREAAYANAVRAAGCRAVCAAPAGGQLVTLEQAVCLAAAQGYR